MDTASKHGEGWRLIFEKADGFEDAFVVCRWLCASLALAGCYRWLWAVSQQGASPSVGSPQSCHQPETSEGAGWPPGPAWSWPPAAGASLTLHRGAFGASRGSFSCCTCGGPQTGCICRNPTASTCTDRSFSLFPSTPQCCLQQVTERHVKGGRGSLPQPSCHPQPQQQCRHLHSISREAPATSAHGFSGSGGARIWGSTCCLLSRAPDR